MLLSIFFQCTLAQVHLGMADWARLFNECWRWAGLVCSWDHGPGSCICICIMHTHYPYSRSLSLSLTHFGLPSRSGRHYPALTSLSFRISYICVHGVFFAGFYSSFLFTCLTLATWDIALFCFMPRKGYEKTYIPKAFSVHVRTR